MTEDQEWAVIVISSDGRRQYYATLGNQRETGRMFTPYRGSSARYVNEAAAMVMGYELKAASHLRWIVDFEVERIK